MSALQHPARGLLSLFPLVALAALPAVSLPSTLAAQQSGLSKSELVRLVVSSAPVAEQAETVRTRCLSFEPTEGDWRDLRNLGAAEAVVAAARECARLVRAIRISLSASRLTVRAGDAVNLALAASRESGPVPGLAVVLRGSGGGAGAGVRLSRSTDRRGRAVFRLPGGESLGMARYTVSVAGTDLVGATRVTVVTVAAAPAEASSDPDSIVVRGDGEEPDIRVTVRDRFGNPVSGSAVQLAAGTEPRSEVLIEASTGRDGDATLVVPVASLPADTATWELRSGETVLARLPVRNEIPSREAESDVVDVAGESPNAVAAAAEGSEDLAVRAGQASLATGDPIAAEQSFREALRFSPRRSDAQLGLAAALYGQGLVDEAIVWYELAVRQEPDDPDAWVALGEVYAAAGRRQDAGEALARARELDPDRKELDAELADLDRAPGYASGLAWGGSTFDNAEAGGVRRAEIELSFSPSVQVRGGWDRSLGPRSPELIRGPDEWDAWFAGGSVAWHGERLETDVELGQRDQGFDLKQNAYRLTQTVRLSDDARATALQVGGFLGRWFDRDDWIVFSRLETPVGRELSVVASASYGRTIGTNWEDTGRHADKDGRVYLGVEWENRGGLRVQPMLGLGRVDSERSDELTGTLVDALVEAGIPITPGSHLLLFLRHQRPPGSEAFTTIAAGLGFKLGWAGG